MKAKREKGDDIPQEWSFSDVVPSLRVQHCPSAHV
jgi:hypothetical protein